MPVALATGAAVAVLLAFVSSAGGVGLWTEPSVDLSPRDPAESDGPAVSDTLAPLLPIEPDGSGTTLELPAIIEWLLRAIGSALLAVIIGALLVYGWRNRPRVRWRRPDRADEPFEPLPDVAAAVIDDAAAQRAELRRGSPRNAIVECWLRLERAVENGGLERDGADTPSEFTRRVLGHYSVDPAAIDTLSGLYREARFSEHVLGEPEREAAVSSLDSLHESLARSTRDASNPSDSDTGQVPR